MTLTRFVLAAALIAATARSVSAQVIHAQLPDTIAPAWNKGIQPINQENYWNAVNCGKQGGQRPLCVFYDADVCKNDDFEVAMFTPYKFVAYQVWQAVRAKQEPPTPSYSEAQRTRITVKLTPKPAAKNPLTTLVVKRGGKAIEPAARSNDGGAGSFNFDFPAFAPTADMTLDMVGKVRTVSCAIERDVLLKFR